MLGFVSGLKLSKIYCFKINSKTNRDEIEGISLIENQIIGGTSSSQ